MPDVTKSLRATEAKTLIREILANGTVRFTKHALDELRKDGLHEADALSALRSGTVGEGEYEGGEWRYRVTGLLAIVVAAFESESAVMVVTGWKKMKSKPSGSKR